MGSVVASGDALTGYAVVVPHIASRRTCPRCQLEHLFTTAVPVRTLCEECGAALNPDPIAPDALKGSSTKELEAGAEAIRELVAKMKRGER